MTEKINLGIIYGGRSGEHEVSLMSAQSVLSVINRDKYNVTEIGIDRQGNWFVGDNLWSKLQKEKFDELSPAFMLSSPLNKGIYTLSDNQYQLFAELDVVIPVLHGTFCEDGTLQGLLELADIAYVGAGVVGSATCMDKGIFKDVMVANNLPTLAYKVFTRSFIESDLEQCLNIAETISDYPLFTKPANLGSSVGISKCSNRQELISGLQKAAVFDRRVVVEKGVNQAREIEISVLGNEDPSVSIPGEVIPKDIFYTYEEKYINDTADLLIPADLPAGTVEKIQAMAVKAYKTTDCAGMARVDFLIDRVTEEVFLNEINTIPGFTKISMYPKLLESSGIPYADLIEKLIDYALERKEQRDRTEREFRS
jgi:D-alanine-D-alanine ligase